jgi:hypothetical protein
MQPTEILNWARQLAQKQDATGNPADWDIAFGTEFKKTGIDNVLYWQAKQLFVNEISTLRSLPNMFTVPKPNTPVNISAPLPSIPPASSTASTPTTVSTTPKQ